MIPQLHVQGQYPLCVASVRFQLGSYCSSNFTLLVSYLHSISDKHYYYKFLMSSTELLIHLLGVMTLSQNNNVASCLLSWSLLYKDVQLRFFSHMILAGKQKQRKAKKWKRHKEWIWLYKHGHYQAFKRLSKFPNSSTRRQNHRRFACQI